MSLKHTDKRRGCFLFNDSHRNFDVSLGLFIQFGLDSVSVSIRLIRKIFNCDQFVDNL